jgi:hypothetical protein
MAEPVVEIARHTTAAALMTVLENSLNTIDDDVELILADKNSALTALTSAQSSEKQSHFGLLFGGA